MVILAMPSKKSKWISEYSLMVVQLRLTHSVAKFTQIKSTQRKCSRNLNIYALKGNPSAIDQINFLNANEKSKGIPGLFVAETYIFQ